MNRTTRTILVVCIAFATATAATFVVYQAVQRIQPKAVEVAGVDVVVAASDLPAGTMLAAQHVKVVKWPANSEVAGSFSNVKKVEGRGLKVALGANDPITDPKLAAPGTGVGLPPEGMRAVSVKVDDVVGVAGFAVPGTRVDVLATFGARTSASQEPVTHTILSNVLVLSSGTRSDQERKDARPPTVVLLAVVPEDVEKIATAASAGKITLSLRNPRDERPTETAGVALSALMRGAEPPPPPPVPKPHKPAPKVADSTPPPPPLAQERHTVQVIRATKVTEQELP